MLQATGGVPLDGAFGNPRSQVLVIVSSDYYVAGLAGLLDLHWLLPGYQPDYCAPGGALVNITASVSGKTLTIAWPADHLGWILQALTNDLSAGQWFDLPGTGTAGSAAITINPANLAVFYRLSRP